ncbi:hypothetical protein F4803DRAFT_577364 [Xylaria telfairii]|nr:hypothetical protein F4803DRAFT_577364 [Xylaria telfairii]
MILQLSTPTRREPEDLYIPPELFSIILNQIPGPDWPEVWFSMRAVCRVWRVEVEKLFVKRYLPSMTISVWQGSSLLKYASRGDSGERALFEVNNSLNWDLAAVLLSMPDTEGKRKIWLPDLGMSEYSDLVDIQVDNDERRISILWLPTVNKLFAKYHLKKN